MSNNKKPYHRFNRTLDEPEVPEAKAQPGSNKIVAPTFAAELELIEDTEPVVPTNVVPDVDSLKFLFGELGDLLSQDKGVAEEAVNTNPVPMEPTIQNPPSTVQPMAEPVSNNPEEEEEDEDHAVDPQPHAPPVAQPVTQPVTEAKVADFHDVADTLTRPYKPTPPPVPTPAPVAPPPVPVVKTGWVFTVHRNKQTNLIERIEADPKV